MAWNTFMASAGIDHRHFVDYETVLSHYDNVKPIRGRTPEVRPLGRNRKYTQCRIIHNALVDSVSAVLYDTECVTIFDNGLVRLNRGHWVSPSTANFMDAVLPPKFGSIRLDRRRIIYTTVTNEQYVVPEQGLMLQAVINPETKEWETLEVIQDKLPENNLFEYKADRKVLNTIRKHMKPFFDAVFVMSSMSSTYTIDEIAELFPDVITKYVDDKNDHEEKMRRKEAGEEEYKNYSGYFYDSHTLRHLIISNVGAPRLDLLSGLGDAVKRLDGKTSVISTGYKAAIFADFGASTLMQYIKDACTTTDAETIRKMMVAIACNGSNYGVERDSLNGSSRSHTIPTLFGDVEVPNLAFIFTQSQFDTYMTDIIKYIYADEVFKEVEVPRGTLPSQSNMKYIYANKYFVNEQDIVTRRHAVL